MKKQDIAYTGFPVELAALEDTIFVAVDEAKIALAKVKTEQRGEFSLCIDVATPTELTAGLADVVTVVALGVEIFEDMAVGV